MKTPKPDIASPRPFWWGGVAALLAGFFFFLSCMLNLVLATGRAFPEQLSPLRVRGWTAQVPPGVLEKWRNLDPELLHRLWRYRALSADLDIGASALITLGFVALLASVVTLADAFEVHAGRAAHRATRTLFVPCFIFAAALAVLDLVFHAGAVTTAGFIYKYFEIDDTMVRAPECVRMQPAEPQAATCCGTMSVKSGCPTACAAKKCALPTEPRAHNFGEPSPSLRE